MANYLRKLVSGKKARFKDESLDVELDLVYVTDHLIVMGYPASGAEGIYRNRRDDAKKFLEHRHGKDFWIFNFCPTSENSYPSSFFEGRVSRYPFPDHHAPPLAILPLAAREIRQWLSGSPERVAVLHCKAGKGRSGTLACAYLLSLDEPPGPPKLKRSMAKKEWAKARADRIMDTIDTEEMPSEGNMTEPNNLGQASPSVYTPPEVDLQDVQIQEKVDISRTPSQKSLDPIFERVGEEIRQVPLSPKRSIKLEDVIALHTSRRMKVSSKDGQKLKQGVSIPSQRRWLYYWSLVLTHVSPPGFWGVIPPSSDTRSPLTSTLPEVKEPASQPKVRLRQITIRMRELTGMKKGLLKVANTLLERSGSSKQPDTPGGGLVWASVARYDDELVGTLERWEQLTREKGDGSTEANHFKMGKRRPGSDMMGEESVQDIFKESKWDRAKMVRSFARVGEISRSKTKEETEAGAVVVHTLRPLSDKKWATIEKSVSDDVPPGPVVDPERALGGTNESAAASPTSSITAIGLVPNNATEDGIVLNAEREVRVKLHVGRVFLGWFWFIPTFHMLCPIPSTTSTKTEPTHFKLTRKEVDFPIGIGSHLVDVDVELEWIGRGEPNATVAELPEESLDPEELEMGDQSVGLSSALAAMQVAAEGGGLEESVNTAEVAAQ
ncbi:hypothetical protein SCHPADRAFT_867729 [Schizopora paradoxa]|uniref:phosphatidylinositol-3,4,5-trisphosphate 3-phosphatase n=1 Tax=Schizopora paradoxa TaxID=27342 RepID=A0A0H2S0V8_9AGAM|nr:hypothetical protein SCHPADRAFT_867729 [Schizopora paradoxa]